MTKRLYDLDSHLQQHTARVVACIPAEGGFDVVLDETALFPEGGGQPSDTGLIGEAAVLHVREEQGEIYHRVDRALPVGGEVTVSLDWARRFDFMQQHTGEHITTGQAYRLYGANNVGFHLSENTVLLDVDKELSDEQVRTIEAAANRAIYENAPVEAGIPSPELLAGLDFRSKMERVHGPVRIVTVDGYDCCACCGTHVSSAGQIGIIKVLSHQKHRGGTRIVIAAGGRALADYSAHQEQVNRVSALLSAKPMEIADATERLLAEVERLKGEIGSLKGQLIDSKLKNADIGPRGAFYSEAGLSADTLRRMALALMKKTDGVCAVFSGSDEEGYKYALGSEAVDMKQFGLGFNKALTGRGGGDKQLIQGSCTASLDRIRDYLQNV